MALSRVLRHLSPQSYLPSSSSPLGCLLPRLRSALPPSGVQPSSAQPWDDSRCFSPCLMASGAQLMAPGLQPACLRTRRQTDRQTLPDRGLCSWFALPCRQYTASALTSPVRKPPCSACTRVAAREPATGSPHGPHPHGSSAHKWPLRRLLALVCSAASRSAPSEV